MGLVNKRIVSAVLLIIFIVSGSYAAENIIKSKGVSTGGIIKISDNGKVIAYISDEVLNKLMEKDIQDDELLRGPTLISAIKAAGVVSFNEIEVKGTGSNDLISLKQKDVDNNLILYISSSGKIDLGRKGSNSPMVTNVNEINVK